MTFDDGDWLGLAGWVTDLQYVVRGGLRGLWIIPARTFEGYDVERPTIAEPHQRVIESRTAIGWHVSAGGCVEDHARFA